MKRPWQIGTLFLLCLAFVLPGMVWLTLKTLELDRARALAQLKTEQARRQEADSRRLAERARSDAEQQELLSTALWRMDWTLTPIVAQEAARPYYVYDSFYETPGAGETKQVPSPLLMQPSEYVLLHFQLTEDDTWTSPQSPTGSASQKAIRFGIPAVNIDESGLRLARLRELIHHSELVAMLPQKLLPAVQIDNLPWASANLSFNYDGSNVAQQQVDQEHAEPYPLAQAVPNAPPQGQQAAPPQAAQAERQEYLRGNEYQNRRGAFKKYEENQLKQQRAASKPLKMRQTIREGETRPVWIDSHLLLARRVVHNEQTLVQGCWLNWPAIKSMLLGEISDSLPGADLVSVAPNSNEQPGRTLATLPVKIVVPPSPGGSATFSGGLSKIDSLNLQLKGLSPIQLSLLIAWGCLVLAASAVGVLLLGVVNLSERRAAFVAAVTHELRTPLTTFRMYAEMLAEGMVPNARRRQEYMETLRVEADRLSHLVENVLSYARIERGSGGRQRVVVTVASLLDQFQSRLIDRAQQAEMDLVIDADDTVRATTLNTDPAAIEQILFNLVDNACKYARPVDDARIHLRIDGQQRSVDFTVQDHGPGISKNQSRRLFQPFSKSVQQAAHSAPGVGLELALCRRLANSLGGRLELKTSGTSGMSGAEFVLTVPRDPASSPFAPRK